MLETASHPDIETTSIEEQKARLDGLWSAVAEVSRSPGLLALFDRTSVIPDNAKPEELLAANGYPARSVISDMDMGEWTQKLDPVFVRDGYMYLFRGDNPGQGTKGFYARTYGYGKKSTERLASEISSPTEVGYALYRDDRYLQTPREFTGSVAAELAYMQSAIGGSSFISTTTNLEAARSGTGNDPSSEQKESTEIYIVKVPIESVINSNTGNHFGRQEDEYLVADYIAPSEVVGQFGRDEQDKIHARMNELLGQQGYEPTNT